MSVFTNPASASRENAEAYVRAVVGLVADADPLEVLSDTPALLARSVTELSERELKAPEAPGKWSVLQVVQHLTDSGLVFGVRVRRVLAEDRPILGGYDQDLWAERLRYTDADAAESLELFRALRTANLRLLRRASADDFRRTSEHAERGEETLEYMIRLYAGHDIVHQRQIERIRGHESVP